ncbi:sulfatase-like hydrolase/transferase [Dietzia aurantiaca]|uniref:sulfatase family protein n=1 Tax=Dietzia aurantiaca TaxID=983873 RepID=UPI001E64A0B6|nr:sulfatase-like hydrolase/transferase [Dietzia aurantiaca]MCD2262876.1 sulfatase-like hydrolase/transferase [Dietzia aurantiaca]
MSRDSGSQAGASQADGSQSDAERRPNFVLIMADQLRADHLGFGGNAVVKTPNLDTLAARGTEFTRTYVANPICMPNRASLLTSRVPSAHGTRFNGISLDQDANTFVRALRAAGYRTSLVGKAHLQNYGNAPEFARAITANGPSSPGVEPRRAPGWDRWENQELHSEGLVDMPEDYYGFDHVELAIDHADYSGGHYEHWLRAQGFDPAKRTVEHAAQRYDGWDQVYQPAMPEELYPTSWVGTRSVEAITTAAESGEPFFLQCSFPDPHHPFAPPGRFYDMYDPAEIPLPETFYDSHEGSSKRIRNMINHRGEQRGGEMAPFAPSEEQFRQAAAKEYGAISFIDEMVGKVVQSLSEAGVLDNTVIIVTSDHGDMFGDHGLLLKMGLHYEGCVRVPLTFTGPGVGASSSNGLTSSLDIGPTILDLAGVPGYTGIQGHSLVPALTDPGHRVRDALYIEEDQMFDAFRLGIPTQLRTAITDDARVTVLHGSDDGELFDLRNDRNEMHNLWNDPEYADLKSRMLFRLLQAQLDHTDTVLRPTAMA